jgi:hypothetical protein
VAPNTVYREEWVSFDDWLGNEPPPTARPFEEAREFVRSLGLESYQEWLEWRSSGKRPGDIPTNPNRTYAGKGWKGWSDFLGNMQKKRPKTDITLDRAIQEVGLPADPDKLREVFYKIHGGNKHAANEAWKRAMKGSTLVLLDGKLDEPF